VKDHINGVVTAKDDGRTGFRGLKRSDNTWLTQDGVVGPRPSLVRLGAHSRQVKYLGEIFEFKKVSWFDKGKLAHLYAKFQCVALTLLPPLQSIFERQPFHRLLPVSVRQALSHQALLGVPAPAFAPRLAQVRYLLSPSASRIAECEHLYVTQFFNKPKL
jgi:hypothetical protein